MESVSLGDFGQIWRTSDLQGAKVTLFRSLAECEASWREATSTCACTVFQTFEWLQTWSDTIGRLEHVSELIIHVVAQSGRTLLLLPLGIYPRRGGRTLQFLGGGMTDYNAPLIDPDFAARVEAADVQRLWQVSLRLLPKVDLVRLNRMPAAVDGVPNPLMMLPGIRHRNDAFGATLPDRFEEFIEVRSSRFFAQNRRSRRRLGEKGRAEIVSPGDTADRIRLVRNMLDWKSKWQRAVGAKNTLAIPEYRAFYEQITCCDFKEGSIHVAGLEVDGEHIAALWGAVFRNRYSYLVGGYNEDWSHFSVGRLMMESAIQLFIERPGVDVFDLTEGDEAYKASWADHSVPLYEYLAARSVWGLGLLWVVHARHRLRAIPGLRDRVRSAVSLVRSGFRKPT